MLSVQTQNSGDVSGGVVGSSAVVGMVVVVGSGVVVGGGITGQLASGIQLELS